MWSSRFPCLEGAYPSTVIPTGTKQRVQSPLERQPSMISTDRPEMEPWPYEFLLHQFPKTPRRPGALVCGEADNQSALGCSVSEPDWQNQSGCGHPSGWRKSDDSVPPPELHARSAMWRTTDSARVGTPVSGPVTVEMNCGVIGLPWSLREIPRCLISTNRDSHHDSDARVTADGQAHDTC